MSKLIPKLMLATLPNLYDTENDENPLCYIKLFTPDSDWTWYIMEFSKEDNDTCFGYVIGHESELGYFSLSELEEVKGNLGLAVERDNSFSPVCLSEVKRGN